MWLCRVYCSVWGLFFSLCSVTDARARSDLTLFQTAGVLGGEYLQSSADAPSV
jgi:hypothetical protein